MSTAEGAVKSSFGDTFLHRDRLRDVEIVLVEDEEESRKMLTAVLRAAGAKVLAFDSSTAALEAIDQHLPDLVITDIAMPVLDGYAFTRALRKRNANLKVIALSAFSPDANERRTFEAYLLKPIDPFQLVDEVARVAMPAAG
jgi:CheY-like chemotaxis protein